jgi:mRNA-degrading endonuclease RelE of RelBE toxin-antitoxin system
MPLDIQVTTSFARAAKKLHSRDKKVIDQAVRDLADSPNGANLGEEKRGDLAGYFVYKFKLNNQETLLAYALRPDKFKPATVIFMAVGPHENFYAQLKRVK